MKQRIFAMILSLALVLAFALPALAADYADPNTVELIGADGATRGTYSLDAALATHTQAGDTLKLLEDITTGVDPLIWEKELTVDFNGHTINGELVFDKGAFTLKGGSLNNSYPGGACIRIVGAADVTLEEMTMQCAENHAILVQSGSLRIESGSYSSEVAPALGSTGGRVTIVTGTFQGAGNGAIVQNEVGSIRLAAGSVARPGNWLGTAGSSADNAAKVIIGVGLPEGADSGQSGTGAITAWKNPGFVRPTVKPAYTGGESVMQAGGKAAVEQAAPWLLLEARASGAALLEELVLTVGENYNLYVSDTGGTVFALTASGRAKLKEAGAETLTLEFANCLVECTL